MPHPNILRYVVMLLVIECARGDDLSLDSFKECLASKPFGSLGYCVGVGAITKLQSIDDDDNFNVVDGVVFSRDEQMYREAHNFAGSDPSDFRTIANSMDQIFSKRTLRWDMSFLHPGLAVRVAPSLNTGGVLEFVLDPHEDFVSGNLKEVSTGRLMARQFLLPLLLGLKFNIATVVPIIFGALALIAKKFLLVSKIGLVVSSAYALGSLLFNNYNHNGNNQLYGPTLNPSFGGIYNGYPHQQSLDSFYRNKEDKLKLHGNIPLQAIYSRDDVKEGRNFAWSDDNKP